MTDMYLSDDELYGPLRTNEEQYRHDLTENIVVLTDEEKNALVTRARSGDETAKDAIIEQLLPQVARFVQHHLIVYGWQLPGVDYGDLIGEANVTLVEALPRALSKQGPYAYLMAAAKNSVSTYCQLHNGPISIPKTPGAQAPAVESLDAPMSDDEDMMLLDFLPSNPRPSVDERLSEVVMTCVNALSEQHKPLIVSLFGLDGVQAEMADLANTETERKRYQMRKKRALDLLRSLLPEEIRRKHERSEAWRTPIQSDNAVISDEKLQRLEAACSQLQARKERVTVEALAKESSVHWGYASAFITRAAHVQDYNARLATDEQSTREADRLQKFSEAFRKLEAQGKQITGRTLAEATGMGQKAALEFLRDGRPPKAQKKPRKRQPELVMRGGKLLSH